MSTVAYVGRGSSLNLVGSPNIKIAQLQKFSFSGIKSQLDDITNLDSPSAFKEVMPVMLDPGEISMDGILDPANTSQSDLNTYLQSQTKENWEIDLSDGVTKITFSGYVTEYVPVVVDYAKALTFSAKITITGPVTIGS